MLNGWRIVPAGRVAGAFDGEGARLYGGRWNSPGLPMVYASEHQSLAALELRVHIDAIRTVKRFKCFSFYFDRRLLAVYRGVLPKNWRTEPPSPALQAIGDDWLRAGRSVLLAVPSVIIPDELYYLINPRHPDFPKIKIDRPSDFTFDRRLVGD